MSWRPVTLEGEYVRLEPLADAHLPALCEVGLDPELWRWTIARAVTPEQMREYVAAALRDQEAGRALPFAIVERSTGRVVGSTRCLNLAPADRRLEIGSTWLGRPWQRTALNTEAKYLLLRHAFEVLDLLRVEFKTDALNERSRQALRRLGAVEEGILRQHMITSTGRVRDTVYYSVLQTEWPDVKPRLEARLRPA